MSAQKTSGAVLAAASKSRPAEVEPERAASCDGELVERTQEKELRQRKLRAGIHLRTLRAGCVRPGARDETPQSLPALPLERASGHSHGRQAVRLSEPDGTDSRLGAA